MSSFGSLALLVVLAAPSWADPPAPAAKEIAPFLGDSVAVVARIDVDRVDVEPLAHQLLSGVTNPNDREAAKAGAKTAAGWVDALRKAGVKSLYLLIDPADMPGPPVIVVPLPDGADAAKIGALLGGKGEAKLPFAWPSETVRGAVVSACEPAKIQRVRDHTPAVRPDLAAALASAGDAPIVIAAALPDALRRSLEESLPELPAELGGGPIAPVARGTRWAALAMRTEPKPSVRVTVEAADPATAGTLVKLVDKLLTLAAKTPQLTAVVNELGKSKPEVRGREIAYDFDLGRLSALVGYPLRGARASAVRSQCNNNLKMIALAMHNYHSAYNNFPPAFSADKQGKPLLSWRVHILPYLDAEPLYRQFHLDEPWDSPHNKALISKMPPTLACPASKPALAAEGKTTYVTPRGKSTIFPGAEGVKIGDITDGTSNTLLVLDLSDDHAVIWTKPDDWEVGETPGKAVIYGKHDGSNSDPASFADGSVRAFSQTLTDAIFRALLSRNGNEVIRSEDF